MRPINLIPAEQRRGSSRGHGARTSLSGYIVLGALGAAVLCALAVVLTSNQINSKTEELAEIQGDSQQEKQVADALRPYGQFADLQRARMAQVKTVAESRYDWERPLRQLSRAIPRNVWLLSVGATRSSGVGLDSGGGGEAGASYRENPNAPSFAINGCTYSQHAVARMMIRMRNLDDVTAVHLSKSVRKDASDSAEGPAPAAEQGAQEQEEISDCTGSARVTTFEMTVEFGGASPAGAAGATAAVPPGAAAPIADANAAATQGAAASAAAGGTTP